jgi:hypothetical protein
MRKPKLSIPEKGQRTLQNLGWEAKKPSPQSAHTPGPERSRQKHDHKQDERHDQRKDAVGNQKQIPQTSKRSESQDLEGTKQHDPSNHSQTAGTQAFPTPPTRYYEDDDSLISLRPDQSVSRNDREVYQSLLDVLEDLENSDSDVGSDPMQDITRDDLEEEGGVPVPAATLVGASMPTTSKRKASTSLSSLRKKR